MSFNTTPKFILPHSSSQRDTQSLSSSRISDQAIRDELWVDLYTPESENEIAVRPARIKEVKLAIDNSSIGRNKGPSKVLILTGRSGCGKSTLARILCQSMGYQIIEWVHNLPSGDDIRPNISTIMHFQQFLNQSIRTPTLGDSHNKKVILIDDIPNLALDLVKTQFHSILSTYIEVPLPFLIIFVISDSWILSDTYRKNNETRLVSVRDLIPPKMSEDRRIHTIEFLPITKSATLKAMNNILTKESIKFEKNKLEEIAELSHGDIRAAINMLQFYSTRETRSDTVPRKKRKRDDTDMFETNTEPLSLFHAVGKVLYAKRDSHGYFESKPEDIINKLPVDNDLFISYLHENFITFHDRIEDCTKSLDSLSVADTLRTKQDWQNHTPSNYRCLESMYGIMSSRKGKVGGILRQVKKPTFFDTYSLLQRKKAEEIRYSILRNDSINEDDVTSEQEDIQSFSEDEYDAMYGDDTDIVEMLGGF